MSILNRLGNKTKLVKKLLPLFPPHKMYGEPFFGTGSVFFNKPKVKYNYLNDLDKDVYNLFRQVVDNKDELVHWIEKTPITETQFKLWGKGMREESDVLNAVRFLWISNFGLYGKPSTLRIGALNPRASILREIDLTFDYLKDAYFFNTDFRDYFRKLDYKTNKKDTFIYNDSPYLETDDNYSNSFTEEDTRDLFEVMLDSGVRFAISEFNHPFVLEQIKKHKLNLHILGERTNLKNKRVEILATNYQVNQHKLQI